MQAGTSSETLDAGPRQAAAGAERFCAASGQVKPVAEMIRFVVAPDGGPVADLKRRLPGRGLWITGTREAIEAAVARKVFARGFKRDIRVAADFVETTERLIEQAVLDALAVARKAGKVAMGFAKTEAALADAAVAAILHAAEAAPDGVRKLDAALRRRPDVDRVVIIGSLSGAQLDLALGRPNVIHAALLAGPESGTFLARAARLDRFRSGGA